MNNKININPCDSARTWAAYYIEEKFNIMWSYREKVITEHDPEIIHDMRVASRRLRSALKDFRSCIPKPVYRKILGITKKLTEHLGRVRDMDILDEHISAMADASVPARTAAVGFLAGLTSERRIKAKNELVEFLHQLELDHYPQDILTLSETLRHG